MNLLAEIPILNFTEAFQYAATIRAEAQRKILLARKFELRAIHLRNSAAEDEILAKTWDDTARNSKGA